MGSKNDNFTKLLHLAESAALLAGHQLKGRQTDWGKVKSATAHDVKISADCAAEALILETLASGSDIPVLSEESGRVGKEKKGLMWIVDPLDGSINYLRQIPLCCVSIALFDGDRPILGVVYDFNQDELFSGLVGNGATLNQASIAPSQTRTVSEAVIGTGFPANTDYSPEAIRGFVEKVRQFRKVRLFGSAALSLSYVACGRTDVYHEENIMFWDVAAGCALVKAAGGSIYIQFNVDGLKAEVMATNGRVKYGALRVCFAPDKI